ncbi:MAG: hypothetical protein AB7L92_03465 [Alphaproteobacteria bacterium]
MKKILSIASLLFLSAAPAFADIPPMESEYTRDRSEALEQFNPELGETCLKDFSEKRHGEVKSAGEPAYNDLISRGVYKTVFWNHSDRGVAFTMPVKTMHGEDERAGDIACLYSVRGKRLYFELSQQLF